MIMNRKHVLLASIYTAFAMLGLASTGCSSSTSAGSGVAIARPELENSDSITACLPAGVTLDSKTTDKEGDSETVKDTLARLKATVKGGKLYDLNKREIHFYTPTTKGLEILREPEYRKLSKKYSLVLLGS